MNLSGIIAIAGKPGLYKVLAQSKNGLIVESLIDGKRTPAYSTHKVSALEDISIYTYSEDVPLSVVFKGVYDKENGGAAINHLSSGDELRDYLMTILPEYDQERVYASDLKKLFSWYNLMHKSGKLVLAEEEEVVEESKAEEKAAKPAAKKITAKKDEKSEDEAPKKAAPKKKPAAKASEAAEAKKKPAAKKAAPKKD
ncbi:MAG: hypothetical protein ACJAUV_000396 [Flavobacteriales bacterium]|jgi:hypothetical protein